MTAQRRRVFSDLPIPPGEILAEEMECIGMTRRELAGQLDLSERAVDEIIRGERAVTPGIAAALGHALGGDPSFWTNLEADYRMTPASRGKENEL